MAITQARTMTYNGTEFYARTHKNAIDGLTNATTTEAGLMSPADKTKLDGLQNVNPQTNAVTYHNATTSSDGLMSAADKTKLDGLHNTTAPTYANATTSTAGLMSPTDKTKLDGLHNTTVPTYSNATTTSAGLMSPQDKQKLDGLNTNSNAYHFTSSNNNSAASIALTPLKRDANVWPHQNQKVMLSKKVSECRTGIVLVWRLDAGDENYHYQFVPKYHVIGHANKKILEVIPFSATESAIKIVIVNDNMVYGTSDNYNSKTKANKLRLHEILEF